jgi:hypothetical protein
MVCVMTNKELAKELFDGPLTHRLNTPVTETMKREVVALSAVKGWKEADLVRAAVAAFLKEARRKR